MKKLGIVGGTGPESTIDYYQSIIAKYQEKRGTKEELPELLINSINMYRIFELLENDRTEELVDYLAEAVNSLERAGAEFAVIAANTPHIVFEEIQQKVKIPMISIIEETVSKAHEAGLEKIGLLGTKFTMENDFFKIPFTEKQKDVFVPTDSEQAYIHEKIVEELENGIVNPDTKKEYLAIVSRMIDRHGIEGIILGCTEFPMIFKPEDLSIPQLNTTEIHVDKIVETIFDE
ncbi:aspartate/glutamate racemase family protein [Planococcus salinus]|uniref:Amino acid racemase n=1 Tax=Planococcus salinus TaxID=1848460 RepID=A0A3M8P851_9BACL|nr:amino acid racemase [Planococcus salinus]RNF39818.1 amino acid racemase [Planococcus salinus]